jgi:multiple sugar transport system ATP-binding protein
MGKIEIDDLTKIFNEGDDEVVAVDNLDIVVYDGEFLVLVGPSGCGKSTTLRCIAGLERVTEGEIFLNGEPITEKRPMERNIAMVFQSYALYPHMTARENMAFGLRMTTDLSDNEITERVTDTAEMMGIQPLLDSRPGELSGGQQQRVALGRAIVREPKVFLMDEPLSNLDAKLRTQMRTELQELQQRLDVTTVYVTHDQTEAMTMGDRIAVLNGGELQQVGTPLECYHEPNNIFVAGFIGSPSMNFFQGRLDGTVFTHEAFEYRFRAETVDEIAGPRDVTLGIRPEDIRPASEGETNQVSIKINVVEPLGDTILVYFDLAGQDYKANVPADQPVSPGEQISITFPEDRIHLFDTETGTALKNRSQAGNETAWGVDAAGSTQTDRMS